MKLDLAFEVTEVDFDEFERRAVPRENISLIEIQNKTFFTNVSNAADEVRAKLGSGIEVNEVAFNQFERRKHPR